VSLPTDEVAEVAVVADVVLLAELAVLAVVDACLVVAAMHPVRTTRPATLATPATCRADRAGCGRRRGAEGRGCCMGSIVGGRREQRLGAA